MTMYKDFKKATSQQRSTVNSKIRESMQGIKSKTADLVFDLSNKDTRKLDINKNAAIKALELVSDLLSRFELPARPKLEYHGIIKNATSSDGIVSDGVIRIGAVLSTLMGHKAHIDIPVIVRSKSLLEPAIFFYNDAPYVMCGPAIDELVKNGTLMKELQPRQMYSGPMTEVGAIAERPRTPIINLPHMFSPGIRNPWMFRRHSDKEQRKRTNIDTPAERPEIWPADLPQQCLDQAEREKEGLIPVGSKVKLIKDYEVRNRGGGTIVVPSGEEGCVLRDEKGDGMCLYIEFKEMGIKDIIPYKFLKKADADVESLYKPKSIYEMGGNEPQFFDVEEEAGAEGLMSPSEITKFTPRHQEMLKKVPFTKGTLEHTETGRQFEGKTIDELLKMPNARETLYILATKWGNSMDGRVLNDLLRKSEGSGTKYTKPTAEPYNPDQPQTRKDVLDITQPVGVETTKRRPVEDKSFKKLQPPPTPEELGPEEFELMARKKAATVEQIKNHVQDMLREGYQAIDIKAAIKEQFPEHAEEALSGLDT